MVWLGFKASYVPNLISYPLNKLWQQWRFKYF